MANTAAALHNLSAAADVWVLMISSLAPLCSALLSIFAPSLFAASDLEVYLGPSRPHHGYDRWTDEPSQYMLAWGAHWMVAGDTETWDGSLWLYTEWQWCLEPEG